MEVRLRDAAGADVAVVDTDELPSPDSLVVVDGRYYLRSQRNEGQWREVQLVKLKGDVKPVEREKPEGSLPPVTMPAKAEEH